MTQQPLSQQICQAELGVAVPPHQASHSAYRCRRKVFSRNRVTFSYKQIRRWRRRDRSCRGEIGRLSIVLDWFTTYSVLQCPSLSTTVSQVELNQKWLRVFKFRHFRKTNSPWFNDSACERQVSCLVELLYKNRWWVLLETFAGKRAELGIRTSSWTVYSCSASLRSLLYVSISLFQQAGLPKVIQKPETNDSRFSFSRHGEFL